MDGNFKNNTENISVGIFRSGNTYTAKIIPFNHGCRDAMHCVSTAKTDAEKTDATHCVSTATEQPVFIRSFSEMVLALGYCNVMNQLSKKSVERIMQMTESVY